MTTAAISRMEVRWLGKSFGLVLLGSALIALAAQLRIVLPWTPVPITGQTAMVAFLALTLGPKRAPAAVASYLGAAALGLPILAGAQPWVFGPTSGYLVGMLVSSYIIGKIAMAFPRPSLGSNFLSALVGSSCVFACGLGWLAFWIPPQGLLTAGLWPFLPGDLLKSLMAALAASQVTPKVRAWFLGCLLLGTITPAHSAEVAFIEVRNWHGETIQLEPGFNFAHLAIRVEGGWLHAHPGRGVEWTDDLAPYGRVAEIVNDETISAPTLEQVHDWIGRAYDLNFNWSDDEFYCSELAGKLLGVPPTPMRFDADLWRTWRRPLPAGELGVSPQKVYDWLKARVSSPT